MSRDFFKRSADGSRAVSGSIIADIQTSLNAISAFDIDVDGIFGRQTEQALSGPIWGLADGFVPQSP